MMEGTVVVTDSDTAAAVTVIRSLGAAGWRVIAASPKRAAPGAWSRYASERHVVPSFETESGRAAEAVTALAHRTGADAVVPVTDKAVIALSRQRDLLAPARLAAAEPEAIDLARDKHRTTLLAGELGIPTPRSEVVADREMARRVADKLGYPVVLKPIRSHERVSDRIETRSVSYAFDPSELGARLDDPDLGQFPVLLQEHVPGIGVGIELLMSAGRPLASFQHRRLRQVPVTGGMSASRVSEEVDQVLLDHAVRLLGALEWTGLAMVEFRVGPDGPHLLEVNGRIWGSIALPVRAGLDFPRLLVELVTGRLGIEPPDGLAMPAKIGVECRNLELELRWITGALAARPSPILPIPPGRGEIARVVRGLLDPRNEFDVQVLRDPLPSALDAGGAVARELRRSAARVAHRLGPRR